MKSLSRRKLYSSVLALVVVLGLASFMAPRPSPNVKASGFSTKIICKLFGLSQTSTISASAPATVARGSTFKVTNVTATGSTSPIAATVDKITSFNSLTNASPSAVQNTWTGPITTSAPSYGYTIHYPDSAPIKATGPVGSKVKMRLTEIDTYLSGVSSPLSCKADDDTLIASPGYSLEIASVTIVDPPVNSSTSHGGSSQTSNSSSNKTKPSDGTNKKSADKTGNGSNISVNNKASEDNSTASGSHLTIRVNNASNSPIAGAEVKIDGNVPTFTNSQGDATFSDITAGQHNVEVTYNHKTVSQSFVLAANVSDQVYTIQIPGNGSAASSKVQRVILVAGIILLPFAAFVSYRFWRKKHSTPANVTATSSVPAEPSQPSVNSLPSSEPEVMQPKVIAPTNSQPPTPTETYKKLP